MPAQIGLVDLAARPDLLRRISRHHAGAAQVTVKVNGLDAPVPYAGPQLQFAGLDQVNVRLPHALAGSGDAALVLTVAGTAANAVHLTFK